MTILKRYFLFVIFVFCATASLAQTSTSAIARLNQYRADLGLSQLIHNDTLAQTALAHSQYLSALQDRSILSKVAPNGTPEMHLERVGYAKFTGVTLGDRAKYQGYPYGAGEQVIFNERDNSGAAVVDQLIATVYHRSGLLNPAWSQLGAAVDTPDSVLVLGEGPVRSKVAADWIAFYPANKSFVRRVGFQNELPDPAPERPGQWLGLPISVHAAAGQRLQVQRFSVQKISNNPQIISGKVLDATRDRLINTNEAFFLPTTPLEYASEYEVTVQLLVNQAARTLSWTFQTPPNPFNVLPRNAVIEVTPGTPQTLELEGVQGNWGWQVNITGPQNAQQIEAINLGKGKMQINFPSNCSASCRLLVTVKHEGPHPSTEQREFIVSKAWLAGRPAQPVAYPKELIAAAESVRRQSGVRALAYASNEGRWIWSTGSGSGSQAELNQNVLSNCIKQAAQIGASKCELYPLTAP